MQHVRLLYPALGPHHACCSHPQVFCNAGCVKLWKLQASRCKPTAWSVMGPRLMQVHPNLRSPPGPARRRCVKHDAYAVCDEVYEHLVFSGSQHVSLRSLPGMQPRSIRIGSAGKTFSFTAWKVGCSA